MTTPAIHRHHPTEAVPLRRGIYQDVNRACDAYFKRKGLQYISVYTKHRAMKAQRAQEEGERQA